MKKLIISIIFFLFVYFSQSQNIKFFEQISSIPLSEIDNVMIRGYGFKKIEAVESEIKQYGKIFGDNFHSAVIVRIFYSDDSPNHTVNVLFGSDYSINKFKSDLIENGYLYQGNKTGPFLYKNDNFNILIYNEPNEVGAHEIILNPIKV